MIYVVVGHDISSIGFNPPPLQEQFYEKVVFVNLVTSVQFFVPINSSACKVNSPKSQPLIESCVAF